MSATRKRRVLRMPALAAPVHPFDARYGTDTGGLIPRVDLVTGHANDEHVTAYYGVAPSILEGLVDLWLMTKPVINLERVTFLDVGAGKGRAMLCAAQQPFAAVAGIELNAGLARIARSNTDAFAASGEALAPVSLLEGDALEVKLPEGPLLAFLFHPFEAPVLRRFLARLEQRGGLCDLLYVNAEHASVLDARARWTRVWHGMVPMSEEDHRADLLEIAGQSEYGSTGDELCGIWRLRGAAR